MRRFTLPALVLAAAAVAPLCAAAAEIWRWTDRDGYTHYTQAVDIPERYRATAVGAMKRGLTDRSVTVTLPGGPLRIDWREDGEIVMTGAAAESFRGSFDPADYGV